ncbi:porin family protein [Shewanella sp. AS16]|nr:porin family protein [Shewanella sp. AS16]MCE9687983.1 porin family protein [Shewanella sp. AS16]
MKCLSIASSILILTCGMAAAHAETDKTGFYVGGSLGQMQVELNHGDFDESGVGFGVYGGYHFNEWFGLESHLFVSGDLDVGNVGVAAASWTFAPKLSYQINDTLSVYAKAGAALMAVVFDSAFSDQDFSGQGWTYGVGINAAVTEHLNLRLGYDIIKGDMDSKKGWRVKDLDTEISAVTAGLHYQF